MIAKLFFLDIVRHRMARLTLRFKIIVVLAWVVPVLGHAQTLAHFANGETISSSDVQTYVASRADLRVPASVTSANAVLHEMAVTRSLVLEGKSKNEPRRRESTQGRFDDLYADVVYGKLVLPCDKIKGAAVRAYFDAHPKQFQVLPRLRLTRVVLPVSENVKGESAADWLAGQARAIKAGDTTLLAVADQVAPLNIEELQGDLGWVNLEASDVVANHVLGAAKGDLVGPFSADGNVYLFAVTGRHDGRTMTWQEAEPSVAQRAFEQCTRDERDKLETRLLASYGYRVDDAAVQAAFGKPKTTQP